MAEFLPKPQGANKTPERQPILVQIDPKCLHSALKEFFEPLRTNDSRADFFTVYRKEAAEFDKDYVKKYDEDLNTTLIFAGLFSAVSSAFIIDVQSKLEPNPNDTTAAYMKILIHAVNASLFSDADPGATVWTGPPSGVVTAQALLYASLVTSLFAAFVAVLGKQWINRYIRNHGGSAADKSRDRQRKLDGLEKWHFHLVIESLPIMLQLAVLLLGCALSRYLWTISRPIAGIILAITLLGVAIYILLTLAATIYYDCPYQTPPSMTTRTIIKYLSHNNATFARSLRSLITLFPSISNPKIIPRRFYSGVRHVARVFGCTPVALAEADDISLATVTTAPARVFEDVNVNWEVCKADVRCIFWVFDSTTDIDVIFSTARFAADTIWYPEVAGVLSPHTLADLFFDCLVDGEIVPGKLEHAVSIGMALALVLTIQLSVEPENKALEALCQRLRDLPTEYRPTGWKSTPSLIMTALRFVANSSSNAPSRSWDVGSDLFMGVPCQLSTTHKLWLIRVVLQTLWRCQRIQEPMTRPFVLDIELLFRRLMEDGGQDVRILRLNCFLIAAISLGLQVDLRDLYAPDNTDALRTAAHLFNQQLQASILDGNINPCYPWLLLLAVTHLDPFEAMGTGEIGFFWISKILSSGYPEGERYLMASRMVRLLWRHYGFSIYTHHTQPAWVPPLLRFLPLCENPPTTEPSPHPALITLRILSDCPQDIDVGVDLLPTLTSMLSPDHPLQSRKLALAVFSRPATGWSSPQMEAVAGHRLDKLLQAVGDPFHFPSQDEELERTVHYGHMEVVVVLIEFASSELWWSHLRPSNFASCEDTTSTDEGRNSVLRQMFFMALYVRPEFLCTPTKIATAIRHLEELGCLNTAQVVIMWAWVTGMADVMDQEGWELIEDETLRFCRTHGMRSLAALKRCIISNTDDSVSALVRTSIFTVRYEGLPFRLGRSRRPSQLTGILEIPHEEEWENDCVISQACQLRRLYHIFGYDPMIWQEVVEVEEVDEESKVLLRHSDMDPFVDWECDYP